MYKVLIVDDERDVILLDINMPGMEGTEVCLKIRDYVSCPILFLFYFLVYICSLLLDAFTVCYTRLNV